MKLPCKSREPVYSSMKIQLQTTLNKMINQQELTGYVEKAIPELTTLIEQSKCRNAYDVVRQLFQYTTSQILKHNINAAKKCFSVAEQLYNLGNTVVKNAIENVYVYSFSQAFFCDESKRKEVMEFLPLPLYELYKKQVINSHL